VFAACAPQPVQIIPNSGQPDNSGQPAQSGGQVATPSLVPVNLAGPEMTVGSTWLYADGALLVPVPAGIFTMGHGGPDDPQHQVNLPDFWIYRTKVTNGQYAYCVATGQCTPPVLKDDPGFGDPLHANDPVVGVDYKQATAYCEFVNARLPTEAEWEKTARGPDASIYPWGSGAPNCDLLNYETCKGNTTPVNTYPQGQSYYHAFDMEGNAFEWAADWYQQDYYLVSPPDNPPGPERGFARVVRSSAFNSGTNQTPTYTRFHSGPADHRNNLGFRCVVEDPTYFAPFCGYPATYGTDGIGGGSSGEQVKVDCPKLSILQNPTCDGSSPITTVTLNGPAGSNPTVPQPQCSPTGNTNQFTCTGDGQVSICSQCTVTLTTQPQCPTGYDYVNTSRFKGCMPRLGTGQCLPGFTLGTDPLRRLILTTNTPSPSTTNAGGQCCSFDPASPTFTRGTGVHLESSVFPPCPTGTWPDGQECISVAIQTPYCKSAGIDLKSCQPTGGGGGCPNKCGPGYTQNSDCSCTCTDMSICG
jgi:formylglycine-generating enzyme required for sulfatase activity